ncbi:MAG: class I SAM-dependent methyltransferase [Thermoanaerobaculia bacterium]
MGDPKQDGSAGAEPEPTHGTAHVAAVWDRIASGRAVDQRLGWLDSSLVFGELFQARISGDPHVHWLGGLITRAGLPKGGRWASLGCGAAGQEIAAGQRGLFSTLAAFDASTASLDLARRAASEAGLSGVRFETIDLDCFTLPEAAFDVVVMNMALHHVREIRPALEAIRTGLAPGGALLLNEFVGPRQFQFPDTQLEAVRTLLGALPERLRIDSTTGRPKLEYVRMPLKHWDVEDPSEAIRSDLILPEVERLFEIVVRADYGGTILHLLLENIVRNFDSGDERDAALVRLLSAAEALLIDSGVLGSDFTAIAARPRPAALDAPPSAPSPPPRVRPLALSRPPDSHIVTLAAERTAELIAIRRSRGWKVLQAVRGLFGRRW